MHEAIPDLGSSIIIYIGGRFEDIGRFPAFPINSRTGPSQHFQPGPATPTAAVIGGKEGHSSCHDTTPVLGTLEAAAVLSGMSCVTSSSGMSHAPIDLM